MSVTTVSRPSSAKRWLHGISRFGVGEGAGVLAAVGWGALVAVGEGATVGAAVGALVGEAVTTTGGRAVAGAVVVGRTATEATAAGRQATNPAVSRQNRTTGRRRTMLRIELRREDGPPRIDIAPV